MGLYSFLDETINRGPMTIFQDKQVIKTFCDEAGDYAVLNMPSPRYLVSIPGIRTKHCANNLMLRHSLAV